MQKLKSLIKTALIRCFEAWDSYYRLNATNSNLHSENERLIKAQGDYYFPELTLPPEEEKLIGIWGQRHLQYLKENKQLIYLNLLTSGRLNEYLASVDEQAWRANLSIHKR